MKKTIHFVPWVGNMYLVKKVLLKIRLTVFLSLLAVVQVMGFETYSQETKISLNFKNTPLKEIFRSIEKETEFRFMYSSAMIDVERKIDVHLEEERISKVLDKILKNTEIQYKINGKQILLSLKNDQYNYDFSIQQSISVKGKVVDSSDQPLPGVTVVVKGTTQGTVTNADGEYLLTSIPENATLVFSFVGMRTQEATVQGHTVINVTMEENVIGLEEVVAIGYSTQSRRKVTSSVSSISAEEMQNIPSVSPIQALQGKMAGVSIPVFTGQPGAAGNIVIRGGTTIKPYGTAASGADIGGREPSDPLVIVDGVFRNLNDVNPDDIESIQVMKDASSTAIYGARGANGVVLIKTKTGKGVGKANITFRYQHGIETLAKPYDYMTAREYLEVTRKMETRGIDDYDPYTMLFVSGNMATVPTFINKGDYGKFKFYPAYINNLVAVEGQEYVNNLLAKGWETMDDPANPGHTIIFKDSHYQDVVWNTAHTNNYNISATGSSDVANYNVSLGYIDQGGIFLGTGYKRFSALANSGYKLNNKASLHLNLSYLWNNNEMSDDIIRDLVRGVHNPSLNRLYNDDGTPNLGEGNNPRNRLHQLAFQDNNVNTSQYIMRLSADYEIIRDLHYRPSASLNTTNYNRSDFEKFYSRQPKPRYKYQREDESAQIMTDHVVQYNHVFREKHNLMVLGGFNYFRNKFFQAIETSQRSATDYISTITGDPQSSIINGVVTPNMTAYSYISENKSASYFGQLSYDFADKYLFAASIRRDGFSNFAPKNRYASFPSLSAGWIVSNEEFWKIKPVNQLKIRTSWGKTGLSNLSLEDTYGVYNATLYATYSGLTRKNLPNENLLWETTGTLDAGLDMNLFNSRLNVIFDVYNKLTHNRLADLPLPAETGFSSIKYNVGSLRNRGFEFELNAKILDINDFSWNSNFSFAFNRTVITKLPDNGRDKNRIDGGLVYDPNLGKEIEVGGYAEGERPLGLWAWKSNGIFATDEEAAASPIHDMMTSSGNLGKVKHGGDVNWADLNGDNLINEKDLVFMGYRVPDKIGGMQNMFRYKGFTLRITMDYALGHVINNGELGRALGQGRDGEGPARAALGNEIWQKQGDTGKKYPRYSMLDYDVGFHNHLRFIGAETGYIGVGLDNMYGVDNSIYYSKGDFLAFREVSLSYNVPARICKLLTAKSITLNGGIYNIGYLTAYKGVNPEVYKGYDEGGYPRPRQFTVGATLQF